MGNKKTGKGQETDETRCPGDPCNRADSGSIRPNFSRGSTKGGTFLAMLTRKVRFGISVGAVASVGPATGPHSDSLFQGQVALTGKRQQVSSGIFIVHGRSSSRLTCIPSTIWGMVDVSSVRIVRIDRSVGSIYFPGHQWDQHDSLHAKQASNF